VHAQRLTGLLLMACLGLTSGCSSNTSAASARQATLATAAPTSTAQSPVPTAAATELPSTEAAVGTTPSSKTTDLPVTPRPPAGTARPADKTPRTSTWVADANRICAKAEQDVEAEPAPTDTSQVPRYARKVADISRAAAAQLRNLRGSDQLRQLSAVMLQHADATTAYADALERGGVQDPQTKESEDEVTRLRAAVDTARQQAGVCL
jgi:hypothetical protein